MSIQEKVKVASRFTLKKVFEIKITILCSYHLFGLGDLKNVADVDSGVDWNWPWPWQIVHPRAVALKNT